MHIGIFNGQTECLIASLVVDRMPVGYSLYMNRFKSHANLLSNMTIVFKSGKHLNNFFSSSS